MTILVYCLQKESGTRSYCLTEWYEPEPNANPKKPAYSKQNNGEGRGWGQGGLVF